MVFGEDVEQLPIDAGVGGGEAGHHVQFTAAEAGGDLQTVELGNPCLGETQCLGELRLVQAVGT